MSEKILVINNDPDMVTLLSMLIREKTPYKTEVTNNPLEAIEMVKKDGFSVVIAEMKMPVLDGIQVIDDLEPRVLFEVCQSESITQPLPLLFLYRNKGDVAVILAAIVVVEWIVGVLMVEARERLPQPEIRRDGVAKQGHHAHQLRCLQCLPLACLLPL